MPCWLLLASALVATPSGGAEGSLSGFTSSSGTVYSGLSSFLSTKDPAPPTGYPKAYLNWIFLDDQFNYVSAASNSVAAASATYPAGALNTVAPGAPITIPKNGYIYVWVSNETQGWDVFFDNLSVQYKQGPVLEENHYYPFGLQMKGICDQAVKSNYPVNKYLYNKGSELQNKEFSDGSGLEMYETHFRELDPQLGRWWQIDPKCDDAINPEATENENAEDEADVGGLESMSPYASMGNDPIKHNDPNGDIFGIDNLIGAAIGAVVEIGTQVVSNAISGDKLTNISWGKVGVAAVEGFVTDGASNVTKALVKVGGAIVNSAIDNHGKGIAAIAKGAVVNVAIDKVAGVASKLTKNVGSKALNNVANKVVGSKSSIVKNIVANNNISHKTANAIAKAVNSAEKAVAKQVKDAPAKVTEAAVGAGLDKAHEKINGQN